MIASKPATQSRAVCTLASDTLAEPGRIQFSERFAIWDVPSMLKYQALENYLLQISRSGLFVTRIFAFKIRNVGVIYRSSSSETFVALLTTVAQAISTSVRGSEFFVAYAGEGAFVCVARSRSDCDLKQIETAANRAIQSAVLADGLALPLDVQIRAGSQIRGGMMRSGRSIVNTLSLAIQSAEANAHIASRDAQPSEERFGTFDMQEAFARMDR